MSRRRGQASESSGSRVPQPSAQEMQELATSTHFSSAELGQLSQRFAMLEPDEEGHVHVEKVCDVPEIAMFPLLLRIVSKYNADKTGGITFVEFARAMSTLSGKATLGEKLRFAFDLYDINGNGVVTGSEMFDVFRLMSRRHYTDESLQQIVSAFMAEYPSGLTFDDFSQMFAISDLSKLTLNL